MLRPERPHQRAGDRCRRCRGAGDHAGAARRRLQHGQAKGLVRPGRDHAGGLAVQPGQDAPVGYERPQFDEVGQAETASACLDQPARRAIADDPQRAAPAGQRHRVEDVADPLLERDAPHIEQALAAHGRPRPERRVEPEVQLDRGRPPAVRLGVDHRHHGIDVLVGVLIDPPERRQVQGVRSRDPGRVERGRGVVDGDHRGAEPVGLPGDAMRAPERVVQDHHIWTDRAQRLAKRTAAQREPVPVRGGELERAQLMASARVVLAPTGDDQVVLERSGLRRVARLLVEVGANPAATFGVEQGDVADHETIAGGARRGDRTVHGDNGGVRDDQGC